MKELLTNLPSEPGVYLFKDSSGKIIYVGKALNLKNRIQSYFQKNSVGKTALLVRNILKIETIKVSSEIEALLLEASLIKKHQPYFNNRLKDDKDYLYIIFTKEDFPRVLTGRKKNTKKALAYFGPFTSSNAAKTTLKITRKIFPFRTSCRPNSKKACLSYHLGLCPGTCIGQITKAEYKKTLVRLRRFLNGETKWLIKDLERLMKEQSKKLNFEEAQKIKHKIDSIQFTTQKIEDVEKYLTGPEVLESIYEKQLLEFQQMLRLEKLPTRIECYDISNLSGTSATGSMVVLENGAVSKDQYRRFKIKRVKGINDPAMMAEVLDRRLKNDWPKPSLIIVDGGRTQLNAVLKVLKDHNSQIPVVGLAKKLEELYLPDQIKTLRLAKDSQALYLLQRIRDEAHRFAITYHRKLRSKVFLGKS
jgi:excinuclease ABC subunit C